MLEKLKDKFQDEKHELEKAELNGKHAYEMAAEDLHSSIDAASKESAEKAKAKAEAEQGVAADKGDLADTTSTPGLKDSIGERPNNSNVRYQNACVKILP